MLTPYNFLEGFHIDILKTTRLNNELDVDKYLSKLKLWPRKVQQSIELMKLAISLNRTNHNVSMISVPQRIEQTILNKSAEETSMYQPIKLILPTLNISNNKKEQIKKNVHIIIKHEIQPVFRKLKLFIEQEYMPKTRKSHGILGLENGLEYYKAALNWHLSMDIDPVDLHRLGIEEVARIKKNIQEKVIDEIQFQGNLHQFYNHLQKQSTLLNQTEEDIINGYRAIVDDVLSLRLQNAFFNITSIPKLRIEKTTHDGIAAHYYMDTLWVNTFHPETKPKFTMMALALHEGLPGHHLHVSIMKALSLPNFRQDLIFGPKFQVPFSFPYYTSLAEGWALYSEYIGEELGLYRDSYELFGRYTFEMFRACRLVVDTGIHALGWTHEEGVQYILNYTFLSREQVEKEVSRYITWPGQACSYKVGEIKIQELRATAERRLGDLFDLKEFHWNCIKHGFIPLPMFEKEIHKYIEATLQAASVSSRLTINSTCIMILVCIFTIVTTV